MMTQTHLLIAVAALARSNVETRNRAVIAGALIPDIAIYGLFVVAILTGIPQSELWDDVYWQAGWQSVFAIGNSAPLYFSILLIALLAKRKNSAAWPEWLSVFAYAALLHLVADFPVHSDDAHQHFWPFTNWRFHSPLSYWEHDHYGMWVGLFESVLGIACALIITYRFKRLWVSLTVGVMSLPYLLRPATLLWEFTKGFGQG